MEICLLDIDSKIPNLALMRASAFHRLRGDSVRLGYDPETDRPDLCYASKMFSFSAMPDAMPPCETYIGGPGADISSRMPLPEYDRIMPDYSLYAGTKRDSGYAIGRFTRGCPNACPWCVVPKMDGHDVRWVADLADFWCGQKVVRVLDDNIMADPDLFSRACSQLHDAGVKAIWEALDIRLVNDQSAKALASVRHEKSIHFAWDSHAQDAFIEPGLAKLREYGMKPWRFMFYVLIGFGTTREYDLFRVEELRRIGATPFVMPYDKFDRYQRDFARWCNNKAVWRTVKWADYNCPTNRNS